MEQFDLNEINEVLDNIGYRDPHKKEIGDRVDILDYSSVTHIDGQELDSEADEEMQFNSVAYFIVIETNQIYNINIKYQYIHKVYKQDLIIVNSLTNLKYRVNSGHVKLRPRERNLFN